MACYELVRDVRSDKYSRLLPSGVRDTDTAVVINGAHWSLAIPANIV